MPYKSRAQAAYMHINHPEIAKQWDKEYPHQGKLPRHVKKRKKVAGFLTLPLFETMNKQANDGPPNYRPSADPTMSCGACQHFIGGMCQKYAQTVDTNSVCDDFQAQPIGEGQGPFGNQSKVIGATNFEPTTFSEQPMSPDTAFKVGFMLRCIDENLTDDEMAERINKGLDKQASPVGATIGAAGRLGGGILGSAGQLMLAAGIGIPVVAGAAVGAGTAKMTGDANVDIDSLKKEEMINTLNQLTDEAERRAKIKRKQLGLPHSGVVWHSPTGNHVELRA